MQKENEKNGLNSMTGYGLCKLKSENTEIKVEMRSVNSRFLEINLRMPRSFLALEMDLKKLLQKKLQRGKVDVTIDIDRPPSERKVLEIDYGLIEQLKTLISSEEIPLEDKFSLGDLLSLEGALVFKEKEDNKMGGLIKECFAGALENLILSRQREGQALENHINSLLNDLEKQLLLIQKKAPFWKKAYADNFRSRLEELLEDKNLIQEERLEFELALFAEKKDIEEELQRSLTHVEAFKKDLAGPSPHGRKLDFLVQELGREINTMGSKSAAYELTREVIEAKSVLEQIREQLQNLE